jgi:hypothetical protein
MFGEDATETSEAELRDGRGKVGISNVDGIDT